MRSESTQYSIKGASLGDRVLHRTKELLADIGKLRWDGPFTELANAHILALPSRTGMGCSPIVNVDRLEPVFERAGAPPVPGPVSDKGREGEHEVG